MRAMSSEATRADAPELANTAAIEIRGLTRRFGDVIAVNDVSLTIPRGSFYGFLGPNGAGKSTTVRILTGLLPPDEGDALIEGRSVLREPVAVKRRIGVVPDNLALFERLSIWEHLTMVGRIYGLSAADTLARAEDLLRLLDLWDDRGTYAVDASHGMRKKLALAIALIHSPSTLFLDEPFEGIDPIASKHIRDLLASLARRGVTIFLTSHILEIIERLADRVAIIVKGRIALESSLPDLRASGRSLEEAFVEAAGATGKSATELTWLGA
jgi:ABC-2 type transport system ATP-binding protein